MKKILIIVIFLGILVLAACGGGGDRDRSAADSWYMAPAAPMATMSPNLEVTNWGFDSADMDGEFFEPARQAGGALPARMMIQRANIDMESDDVEGTSRSIRDIAADLGGFVENSQLTTSHDADGEIIRFFSITLRVPVAYFDTAMDHIQALGNVISMSQSADDVTAQFYDTAGRLATRLVEEERVLGLIDEAASIRDLLTLEQRLGQVRTSIEIYRARMESLEGQAAFSTITVTLRQAGEDEIIAAVGFGGRTMAALGGSAGFTVTALQNIVVFLAAAVLPLAVVGVLAFAVFKVTIAVIKRKVAESPSVERE